MQTQSKSGIFKPKIFLTSLHSEPATASIAFNLPHSKKAMDDGYQALIRNPTWDLVPSSDDLHVVSFKWVFRTKLKADDLLINTRLVWLLRAFNKQLVWIFLRRLVQL